jgi:chaperonin GroEL
VIKAGATTETEMKEKKARVEDALHATKAAVEEEIMPGGGVALLRNIPALEKFKLEGDRQWSVSVVRRALEEPIRQIIQNAGYESSTVVEHVKNGKGNDRFKAASRNYTDLVEAGIIDSSKIPPPLPV